MYMKQGPTCNLDDRRRFLKALLACQEVCQLPGENEIHMEIWWHACFVRDVFWSLRDLPLSRMKLTPL